MCLGILAFIYLHMLQIMAVIETEINPLLGFLDILVPNFLLFYVSNFILFYIGFS